VLVRAIALKGDIVRSLRRCLAEGHGRRVVREQRGPFDHNVFCPLHADGGRNDDLILILLGGSSLSKLFRSIDGGGRVFEVILITPSHPPSDLPRIPVHRNSIVDQ
jgi:hypothetical protein